ncbi:zinc metallopeptidase [Isosphaeraceae bacterium EP7]
MFFHFDYMYLVFVAPAMLLAMWAQARVSSAYARGSQVNSSSGITGAEAARRIMEGDGIYDVPIEPVAGHLTDHYDPSNKVLRLSQDNFYGTSLSALGVAAHEAGHAIQDAHRYPLMVVRGLMVPIASFGSSAAWITMIAGFMLSMTPLILAGVILFSTTVVFQLVNLPVEFDASRRARANLAVTGLIRPEEDKVVGDVLNAAAWTYVAATLSSVLTLLYYLYRLGLLGGRSDD